MSQGDDSEEIDTPAAKQTVRVTHGVQAREYLESYLEGNAEMLAELRNIIQGANQLTRNNWTVVISERGVEVVSDSAESAD